MGQAEGSKHIWLAAVVLLGRGLRLHATVLDLSLPAVHFPARTGSGEFGFAAACSPTSHRRFLWFVAAAGTARSPILWWTCLPH